MIVTARFYGWITGTVLTELKPPPGELTVEAGTIQVGNTIVGKNVPDNTIVRSLGPKDVDGNTTYNLNIAKPSNIALRTMHAISSDIPLSQVTVFTTRLIIPLTAVSAQAFSVQLNNQYCNLNVYQRTTGLYVDVGINNQLLIGGVLALDRNKIVRDKYLGFDGDLAFWDSQGTRDPDWTGLNQRYFLGYFYTSPPPPAAVYKRPTVTVLTTSNISGVGSLFAQAQ